MTTTSHTPRWLPSPGLRDLWCHYSIDGQYAVCGAGVMWAEPGHPTTERPHCPTCVWQTQ